MDKIFVNNVSDLCEHQRASYYDFLYNGLEEEFLQLPNPTNIKIYVPTRPRIFRTIVNFYFSPNTVNIIGPKLNYKQVIRKDRSYVIQLYIYVDYFYPCETQKDAQRLLNARNLKQYLDEFLEVFIEYKNLLDNDDALRAIKIKEKALNSWEGIQDLISEYFFPIELAPTYLSEIDELNKKKFREPLEIDQKNKKEKMPIDSEKLFYLEESIKKLEELIPIEKDIIRKDRKNITKRFQELAIESGFTPEKIQATLVKIGKKLKKNSRKKLTKQFIKKYTEDFTLTKKKAFSAANLREIIQEISDKLIGILHINQNIVIGEIPLMTDEGTFLVTGCERVVVSQIIRSPGVYFQKQFSRRSGTQYIASIISNKGSWTRFNLIDEKQLRYEEDDKRTRYQQINFDPKAIHSKEIEIADKETSKTRQLLGNYDQIFLEFFNSDNISIEGGKVYIHDFLRWFGLSFNEIYDNSKYPEFLKKQLIAHEQKIVLNNIKKVRNIFLAYFYNARKGCFFIGEKGRRRLNEKFGFRLPLSIHYLSILDFLAIIDGLIELKYYDRIPDDIDHIKNKHIRCVGELLQLQIRTALTRIESSFLTKGQTSYNNVMPRNYIMETESDSSTWLLDPRYITGAVKIFFKTSPLSQFMDQVNPLAEMAHKRKISAFGPNGLERTRISTKIRDIHPSQYGRLCPVETPEGQNAGLISSLALLARVGRFGWVETPYWQLRNGKLDYLKQPIYLNPEEETRVEVGFSDVPLGFMDNILEEYISVKQNYSFFLKKAKDVNFLFMSPLQIFSLAAGLIPFMEHDDANRALMGSNMQRQAVPLLIPQKPFVGTGLESIAILDSKMVVKAISEGIVKKSTANSIEIEDVKGQKIYYSLNKYTKSNQDTSFNQRSIVWPKEHVYSGQIIADGPGSLDGELALGRNLLLAYMPWEGYNFEDAIIINESLILENALTSIHIQEIETPFYIKGDLREGFSKKYSAGTKKIKRNLVADYESKALRGLIKIGSYAKKGDILVGKFFCPPEKTWTPMEKNMYRFRSSIFDDKRKVRRDKSLRVPDGYEGRVIDIRLLPLKYDAFLEDQSFPRSKAVIRISIAQVRKIEVGDKLAGRHGNKGVISKVLSREDMPYLPDGTPLDIIFNPLGVPSRMNIGQLFESLLGFAGEKLGRRFKVQPFDEIYGKEASRILVNQKLKEAALSSNLDWFYDPDLGGKIPLRDGRTGEYFDNPITVGRSYILKLIHLVEEKIHARSTGPYALITEQPLAGKAKRGGQRFGEMEVWALEAHGCSHTLHELLTVKSDDIDSRVDLTSALMGRESSKMPTSSFTEGLLLLIRELNSLGFEFSFQKIASKNGSSINFQTQKFDIFTHLEKRIKLRNFLSDKRTELSRLEDKLEELKKEREKKELEKEEKKKEKKKKKEINKKKNIKKS